MLADARQPSTNVGLANPHGPWLQDGPRGLLRAKSRSYWWLVHVGLLIASLKSLPYTSVLIVLSLLDNSLTKPELGYATICSPLG